MSSRPNTNRLTSTRSDSSHASFRRTDWFERVFGFRETGGYDRVKSRFEVSSYTNVRNGRTELFLSTVNVAAASDGSGDGRSRSRQRQRRTFCVGPFETPTLEDLRVQVSRYGDGIGSVEVGEHTEDTNGGGDGDGDAQSGLGKPNPLVSTKQSPGIKRKRQARITTFIKTNTIPTTKTKRNKHKTRGLTFQNIIGSVDELHRDPANQNAVFQAASQFNCLEMIHPDVTPAMGITRYKSDRTQGPVCAMACPAGTVYRNYFASDEDESGVVGEDGQLDMLKDVGIVLGNYPRINSNTTHTSNSNRSSSSSSNTTNNINTPVYWKMHNGYALSTRRGSIRSLSSKLLQTPQLIPNAMSQLRIGVHWSTEVDTGQTNKQTTPSDTTATTTTDTTAVNYENEIRDRHLVTQVYCSALPLTYDRSTRREYWEPFARMVLEGAYEATLAVAVVVAKDLQEREEQNGGGLCGNDGSGDDEGGANKGMNEKQPPQVVEKNDFRPRVKVYLTMLGGGAFGNETEWIRSAIERALALFRDYPLDVLLVHYGVLDRAYSGLGVEGG